MDLGFNIGNTWLFITLSHSRMSFVESIHRVFPYKSDTQEMFERGFEVVATMENLSDMARSVLGLTKIYFVEEYKYARIVLGR
jgi:hypothetical protein